MKILSRIFALVFCLCVVCTPVLAASTATQVQSASTVGADGSVQLSVNVHLHLDAPVNGLSFPVPKEAEAVLLNGAQAYTYPGEGVSLVQLPNLLAGDTSFSVSYRLPKAVTTQEKSEKLLLTVPLLSGFRLPIESLQLTVTLPGDVPERPVFSSGYHQTAIEGAMLITWKGSQISILTTQVLKDHETLQMTLQVPETMFPQLRLTQAPMNGWQAAALVLAILAAVYYLICLLPAAHKRVRCFSAPEGITAGDVGTCLTGCGTDLSMLVFTWAQLGYIRMELSHNKKVTLVKRMDMGNERSRYEGKIFSALFHDRDVVAGSSYHYARMCRKVAGASPLLRELFKRSSGNPKIFRAICAASGALSGVGMAVAATENAALQVLLGILLAAFCGAAAWFIQAGGRCLPLRDKGPLVLTLVLSGIWILAGLLLGQLMPGVWMALFQFLCGIAAAYGGRRSERGKRCLAELQALRRFMLTTPGSELQRMLDANPNYFYELAPYALAMGIDRQFARKFGHDPLPEASFLVAGALREVTAQQVANQMRRSCDILNELQKRLPYERLRGR